MMDTHSTGTIRLSRCRPMTCTSCRLRLCKIPGHNSSICSTKSMCFAWTDTVRLDNKHLCSSIRCCNYLHRSCNLTPVSDLRYKIASVLDTHRLRNRHRCSTHRLCTMFQRTCILRWVSLRSRRNLKVLLSVNFRTLKMTRNFRHRQKRSSSRLCNCHPRSYIR